MIEMQIKHTEKAERLSHTERQRASNCQDQLPIRFANLPYCQKYKSVLLQVCQLACDRLLDRDNSLIFDHDQTEICGISDGEIKQMLQMGLLTQEKVFGGITDELKSISFLHKSHQEFLAAVHLCTKRSELSRLFSSVVDDLDRALELEKLFVFVCGLNEEVASEMSGFIMEKVSSDARVQEYRRTMDHDELMSRIQYIILTGADEARKNQLSTTVLKIHDISIYLDDGDGDSIWDHDTWERISLCDTSDARTVWLSNADDEISTITSWPTSRNIETICLFQVDIYPYCNFKENIRMNQLSILHISFVAFSHEQLAALFESIAVAQNLRDVQIVHITCKTHKGRNTEDTDSDEDKVAIESLHAHAGCKKEDAMETLYVRDAWKGHDVSMETLYVRDACKVATKTIPVHTDCKVQLDFSGHKNLEKLILFGLEVGEVGRVVLNRDMESLEKIWLGKFCLRVEGLRALIGSLPRHGEIIELGGEYIWESQYGLLEMTGAGGRDLLKTIRETTTVVVDRVRNTDPCAVEQFGFYNKEK